MAASESWRRTEADWVEGFTAEAHAGLDAFFPGVDVVLILAGEELAHLAVDTIHVGGEGEEDEEEKEKDGGQHLGGPLLYRLLWGGVFVCGVFVCGFGGGAPYKGVGEAKLGAQGLLAGCHLAGVGLVVFTGEVQKAVEDKDAEFIARGSGRVRRPGGAAVSSEMARSPAWMGASSGGVEKLRMSVGLFLTAEVFVEALDFCVGGKEHLDLRREERMRVRVRVRKRARADLLERGDGCESEGCTWRVDVDHRIGFGGQRFWEPK